MAKHSVTLELWYDGAWRFAPLRDRGGCVIKRGTNDPGSDSEPASVELIIDNDSGLYAPLSVAGSLYGKIGQNTKARVLVDDDVRLVGEVASWVPERAIKNDAWTTIVVAGVLQRLGRGTDDIQSAATRAGLALDPVAYWPLESTTAALTPATPALVPLVDSATTPIAWANDATLEGSLPLPQILTSTKTWPGPILSTAGIPSTGATAWSISVWLRQVPGQTAVPEIWRPLFWEGRPPGATQSWKLQVSTSPSMSFGYNLPIGAVANFPGRNVVDGAWHHIVMMAEQVGGTISGALYVDGVAGTTLTPATDTLQAITSLEIFGQQTEIAGVGLNIWAGGLGLYSRMLTADEVQGLYRAGHGWDGELAEDRFTRFCEELAITPTVVGTVGESVAMGPQLPAPVLDEFDEVARTDDASVYETRDDVGLSLRTGASKLNQEPALIISYLGEIVPGLKPVYGDKGARNDISAYSPAGATRRVQQLTGPRNVQLPEDDPQGIGRYQARVDTNPATDDALGDSAGWTVHKGTYNGTWYAVVTADLDAAPHIATAAAALDIGDVLALASLPVDEALDTVPGIIIGSEETVEGFRRKIAFFLIPATPYMVGVLAETSGSVSPLVGHLDTDGSVTTAAIAAGASSLTVATTTGPLWTTDADDCPMDVIVGGQRVSITSIASALRATFGTVASSGWPAADTGQQWVVGAGTASLFSGTGSVGRIAVTALNAEHHIATNLGYATRQRVRTALTLAVTPTGAAINWGVMLRRADASNFFWIDVQVATTGSLTLRVISRIAGASVQLTTAVSAAVHSTSVARILIAEIDADHVIRAKVVPSGGLEPDWELVYDASAVTSLYSGPSVGCIVRLMTGNTNVAPVLFDFDDYSVLNPQTFTVDPGGYQARYPIAAGADVTVQQPIVLAL